MIHLVQIKECPYCGYEQEIDFSFKNAETVEDITEDDIAERQCDCENCRRTFPTRWDGWTAHTDA